MTIRPLPIDGAFIFQNEIFSDHRGAFIETWDEENLHGSQVQFKPSNGCFSYNQKQNTLRGLHYQAEPFGQAKIVCCVAGSIYDVILDLREGSNTYLKWTSISLMAFDGQSLYIPSGCAHGFMTMSENTVVSYLIEGPYMAALGRVIRWNDEQFQIHWPASDPILSTKDANASNFSR